MMKHIDNIDKTLRSWLVSVLLVCSLAVVAEDVTFMSNRRQWEQLPTATLMQMGNNFINIKNLPDSALLCYSIIANRYNENLKGEELKCSIRATCYIGFIIFDIYENSVDAYRYLLISKELAEKHHYDEFVPHIIMAIGIIYEEENSFNYKRIKQTDALDYYKEAFSKALDCQAWTTLQHTFLNLCRTALLNDQLHLIKKELDAYSHLSIPDTTYLVSATRDLCQGIQLLMGNQPRQALQVFLSVRINADSERNQFNTQMNLYEYIYFTLMQLGEKDEALQVLKHYEQSSLRRKSHHVVTLYWLYADYYQQLKDSVRATRYELAWYRAADSVSSLTRNRDLDNIRFLHEIDKMNEEHQTLALKQQHDRQLLWIVGTAALVAIVLLVLLYINRQRIQQSYRQLYEKNQALLAAEDARLQAAEFEQTSEVVVEAPKYSHNQMDDDVMDELWLQIKRVMEASEDIYDEQFTIDKLAELIGAKKNYVSQTINTKTGKNFYALLHTYRIREACRRMSDKDNFGKYSVEGIAHSVGYTSRSHFVRIFKDITGIPPSAYQKLAQTPPEASSPTPDNEEAT